MKIQQVSIIRFLHKIHPFKQNEVARLIQICENSQLVKKVVVFGSAITIACMPSSDIDIAIDWHCKAYTTDGILSPDLMETMQRIQKNSQYNVDILQLQDWHRFDKSLQNSISEGVLIYERNV